MVTPSADPAVIPSVAYMDPGHFATNIQSGALCGHNLLRVVLLANVMAMLFQNLSAKLGVATGRHRPALGRQYLGRRTSFGFWVVSEVAAMATDLAEFLGATLALDLLLHVPMLAGTVITSLATSAMLMLDRSGFRPTDGPDGGGDRPGRRPDGDPGDEPGRAGPGAADPADQPGALQGPPRPDEPADEHPRPARRRDRGHGGGSCS